MLNIKQMLFECLKWLNRGPSGSSKAPNDYSEAKYGPIWLFQRPKSLQIVPGACSEAQNSLTESQNGKLDSLQS